VTGASGMLGSTIVERWRGRCEVYATGGERFTAPDGWRYRPFDLAAADHRALVDWARPDVIVHAGAQTAVDACEADPERALEVNGRAVLRLREAAPQARFLYVSSDAVIGERSAPAPVDSPTMPTNAYGRSKLLGEQLLLEHRGGVVVRTTVVGWNCDPDRQSFAEWLVRSVARGEPITLFSDALFNPIAASLLADELEALAGREEEGVYHVAARDHASKLDFGLRLCAGLGLDTSLIRAGRLADAALRARRSPDQRLDVGAYERTFGRRLPTVDDTVRELVRDHPRRKENPE
jgi:dTDP-4-dehydrorhamnose reductase